MFILNVTLQYHPHVLPVMSGGQQPAFLGERAVLRLGRQFALARIHRENVPMRLASPGRLRTEPIAPVQLRVAGCQTTLPTGQYARTSVWTGACMTGRQSGSHAACCWCRQGNWHGSSVLKVLPLRFPTCQGLIQCINRRTTTL